MVAVVNATSRSLYSQVRNPVPIVRDVGLDSAPVWTCDEIALPQGFDTRSVQPVASRYSD